MLAPIELHECSTPAERKQFIHFAWEIYKDDPNWVPPIISERVAFYDKKKNPFFEHSDAAMFMAKRDNKIIGTIVAIWNTRHNQFHNDNIGFFGGFECINEQAVANALFDKARDWVKSKGATALRGPTTLSFNDEVGLLVDGEAGIPQVLMTHNPRYYIELYERHGLQKAMDLWAWWNPITKADYNVSPKLDRIVELAKKRGKFTIRSADFKQLDREVAILKHIYGSDAGAWKDNWGHVPMTDHEIDHTVRGLKQFADPDLILVAEIDGKPVGVAVTLPNVNRPLHAAYPNPNTPELWSLLKFVWHRRKLVNSVRFVLLGVLPEHRMAGIDAALIWETLQTAMRKGYIGGELGWVLETNEAMNRIGKLGGGHVYRTYRIYEQAIG